MLPRIQNILYATDLSDTARYAFGYAATLAQSLNADITVVYVIDELSGTGKSLLLDYLGEEKWKALHEHKKTEYQKTIQKRLREFCEGVREEMKECCFAFSRTIIREGNPAEEISGGDRGRGLRSSGHGNPRSRYDLFRPYGKHGQKGRPPVHETGDAGPAARIAPAARLAGTACRAQPTCRRVSFF